MSNKEILLYESALRGFEYDGNNLFTFKEWRDRGYSVKKGEKAFIKCGLWKYVNKKDKDKDSDEEKKKKGGRCYMVTACLFHSGQVEKIQEKKVKEVV